MEVIQQFILLIAGLGAGLITGFVGASAVAFMAGFLMLFTNFTPYNAIGLSLITDFFATLPCIYFYRKEKNINLRHGIFLAIIATTFALIAGYLSRLFGHPTLGTGFGIIILITGINFLYNPTKLRNSSLIKFFEKRKIVGSVIFGIVIGTTSGIFGVGGGIMILLILLYAFDYPIKKAIGTSIFIMAFIAIAGGAGHLIGNPLPLSQIALTSGGAIIGATIASTCTHRIKEEKLFRIIGTILIILSIAVLFSKFNL
jgi:uncharacterized membrane protein YfcA